MKKILGAFMFASPFIAITILGVHSIGWTGMGIVWGAVIVVCSTIAVGCKLMED